MAEISTTEVNACPQEAFGALCSLMHDLSHQGCSTRICASCLPRVGHKALTLSSAGKSSVNPGSGSTLLSHALVGFAAALECKVDTFSLGSLASTIGE